MKIKFFVASIILLACSFGRFALAAENISDFQTSVYINADSSLKVDEKITYDFGDAKNKHGIFRDIPIKYSRSGGDYSIVISDVMVDDGKNPLQFTQSRLNSNLRIKIGDANTFVSGVKEYDIHYKVEGAINYFKDHDEIYWNATGDGWPVGITQAAAKIYFPEDIDQAEVKSECFSGKPGSQDKCLSQRYIFSSKDKVSSAVFTGEMYTAGSGLTAVVSLPKGMVYEPTVLGKILLFFKNNGALFLPFLVIGFLFFLWTKSGRDPRGRGVIIAQYNAPDGLTPTEVGTIIDERADNADVSADIINLAINGYIKINRIEEQGLVIKTSDYLLNKLKSEDGLVNEFEKMLMKGLFNCREEVKLSELKESFYEDLKKIKEEIYESVTRKGYFVSNPQKVRIWYIFGGGAVVFGGIVISSFILYLAIGLGVSGLAIAIFGYFMPRKTDQGVAAYEHILGLKEYLSVAEKDRIEFHNAPEKNPKMFEKLLPYAMVLKVEEKWAKQFEGIYNAQPTWYNDPAGTNFAPIVFVHSLNSFSTASNSSLAAMPNSGAGGGVSGIGGGGFSGGGFGGGGGGSW